MKPVLNARIEQVPVHVAWIYAVVAGAWVTLSDIALSLRFPSPANEVLATIVNDLLFVIVSTGLIYVLLRRALARQAKVQNDLADTHERFSTAVSQLPFTFAIYDADRRFRFLNARGLLEALKPLDEVLGRRDEEVFPLELVNAYLPLLNRAIETRQPQTEVVDISLPSGHRHVAYQFTPLLNPDGSVREVLAVTNDMTVVVRNDRHVRRLNRTLTAISAANSVLVRAKDEASLMQGFCDALIGPTGHQLVWVGLVTPPDPVVRVAAQAGPAVGYLTDIQVRCDDSPEGRGPSGTCIRSKKPVVCHDIRTEDGMTPWRERADRIGIRSSIAVPLQAGGSVMGTFTLYSSEPNRFDDEEVALLTEVADDLAFGLLALRQRAALATAQAALQQNEELLRTVLADQTDIICRFKPDGTFTFVNEAYCRFFGKTSLELVGAKWHPDAVAEDLSFIQAKLATLTPAKPEVIIENRVTDAAGSVRWVQFANRGLFDAAGTLVETQSVGRDVTERKQAEEALRESQERLAKDRALLRALLDSIPDLIFFKDQNSLYLGCNRAFEAYSGMKEQELIGKSDLDFAPSEAAQAFQVKDRETLASGKTQVTEEWIPFKNGGGGQFETLKTPYYGLAGETLGLIGISRNITERRQAEKLLRDSELRYRTLIDSGQALIWTSGLDKKCDSFNQAWLKFTGRTLSQELGDGWVEGVHPEDVARCFETYSTAFDRRERFSMDYRLRRHDGEYRWIQDDGSPRFDDEGTFLGYIGHCLDVTEHRKAAAQVRDALAYLGTLLDASPVGIISYDATGQAQTANEAAAKMVGATVDQLLAQNFHTNPAWREAGMLLVAERVLDLHQSERLEAHFTTTFGKEVWLAMQFVPFQRGEVWHLLLLMTEIGEQKRSAMQLRLQSAALDAAANAIVITDLKGTISWVNAAFTKSTGYTFGEAVGQNPRLLKSGQHPREFYEGMWKTVLGGHVWHGEMHNRRKDGTLYDEEMTISPVRDSTGNITHFIAIKQDITERKSLEQQFLRAQRMEGIGLLAGGIAHDLNNVLAPILMGADLLKLQADNERTAHQLEGIVESAKRGAGIVKQVLTFARGIEGERIPLQPKHIIKEMVRMARETFPRNIQFRVDVPTDLWPVIGDPTQIHQVLLNLSVNARDAMPDGGVLAYSARNAEVDALQVQRHPGAKPGPHVVIRVQDSGTGIKPAVMERIFEPFFTTKELGKGTGLGLSTVLGIVRSHGGLVTVDSKLGEGTAFEVYLPANPQAALAEPAVRPEPVPLGQGEMVLVVDDEPGIVQITRSMLEQHGYRVLTARDGTVALTELSQHLGEVKLVITDILMPFMDGVQLIHALRRMAPEVKIIASSGALGLPGQKDRTEEVKALGVKHILHKPYPVEQLLRTVHAELHPEPPMY